MKRAATLGLVLASAIGAHPALGQTPPAQPPATPPPAQQPPATPSIRAPQLREVADEKEAREEREGETKERADRKAAWQNEKLQVPFSVGLGILQSKRFPDDYEGAAPAVSLAVGAIVPLTIDLSLQGRFSLFLTTPMEYRTSSGPTSASTLTESHPSVGFMLDTTLRYKSRAFVGGIGPAVGKFSAHRAAYAYSYASSAGTSSFESESYVFGGAVIELGARFGDRNEYEVMARPSLGSGGERLWGAQFVTFGWAPF